MCVFMYSIMYVCTYICVCVISIYMCGCGCILYIYIHPTDIYLHSTAPLSCAGDGRSLGCGVGDDAGGLTLTFIY